MATRESYKRGNKEWSEVAIPSPIQHTGRIVADEIASQKASTPTPVPACTYASRLSTLRASCDLLEPGVTFADLSAYRKNKFYFHSWVDTEHNILMCLVPKSGINTWKDIMKMNMVNGSIRRLVEFKEEERRHIMDTYTKIMTVRHPFERFVSMYYNKVVRNRGPNWKIQINAPILQKNHPEYTQDEINSGSGVTFAEFANFVPPDWNTTFTMKSGSAFMNEGHWLPMATICQPCQVLYDMVVKTETYDTDIQYVVQQYLGPRHLGSNTIVRNSQHKPENSARTVLGKVNTEFVNVSSADFSKLSQYYDTDFRHFGYTWTRDDHLRTYCIEGGSDGPCC